MRARQAASSALAGAGALWFARAARGLPSSIGASVSDIRPYAAGSPHYRNGRFHNIDPASVLDPEDSGGLLKDILTRGARGTPRSDVPLAPSLAPVDAAELAVTWFGHSSALLEIDGYRVLCDPVWSDRVSPSSTVGPKRMHPVPIELQALPAADAIVISHDHYDHLDRVTVEALAALQPEARFVVPLGIGAHLRRWKVAENRIVELDWDQHVEIDGLRITCTEARHFSGRGLQRDITLWSSWVIAGPDPPRVLRRRHRLHRRFADLGEKYGPFDLTLLPVGAYDRRWPDVHMDPEEGRTRRTSTSAAPTSRQSARPRALGDVQPRTALVVRADRAVATGCAGVSASRPRCRCRGSGSTRSAPSRANRGGSHSG